MKITPKTYPAAKRSLYSFLTEEIQGYVARAGGPEKLSILLGRSRMYIRTKLTRNISFDRLEELYNECREKIK